MAKGDTAAVAVDELAFERPHRFGPPDLAEMGEWLVWRLRDRYPHVDEHMLAGWLRGEMGNNGVMFLRCGNAVGMATIGHKTILDPKPFIEEVFVLVRGRAEDGVPDKESLEHGAEIYRQFAQWASGLGAVEMQVERLSDVPREMIKALFGKMFVRESAFVKLGKV